MATVAEILANIFIAPERGFRPSQAAANQNNLASQYLSEFGGSLIIPQVTISEVHTDQSIITDHPVEAGRYAASISDHAYSLPAQLRVNVAWSRSPTLSVLNLSRFTLYDLKTIYAQLLRLKNNRVLLQVFTGKRVYNNMLIVTLATQTDQRTENTLFVDIEFREILFATTREFTQSFPNSTTPSTTTSPANLGTVTPEVATPANTGSLSALGWAP